MAEIARHIRFCGLCASVPVSFENLTEALSNPTKQKTSTGIARFVNAWLSKAQDQAGKVPVGNSLAEHRLQTMHQLTGGITTPKVGNFWDKPKTDNVIEAENVERKRLL